MGWFPVLVINNSTSHRVHIGLSISVSNHILHEYSQNMNGRRNIFTTDSDLDKNSYSFLDVDSNPHSDGLTQTLIHKRTVSEPDSEHDSSPCMHGAFSAIAERLVGFE